MSKGRSASFEKVAFQLNSSSRSVDLSIFKPPKYCCLSSTRCRPLGPDNYGLTETLIISTGLIFSKVQVTDVPRSEHGVFLAMTLSALTNKHQYITKQHITKNTRQLFIQAFVSALSQSMIYWIISVQKVRGDDRDEIPPRVNIDEHECQKAECKCQKTHLSGYL